MAHSRSIATFETAGSGCFPEGGVRHADLQLLSKYTFARLTPLSTTLNLTALSHEIAETYNDPFVASDGVHNITPWWLAPNGLCQNDLETGDVIETLPNSLFPITLNTHSGPFTYHPQNEALLQWFASETPSSAFGGAYSFPDMTVLTSANVSQRPGCH